MRTYPISMNEARAIQVRRNAISVEINRLENEMAICGVERGHSAFRKYTSEIRKLKNEDVLLADKVKDAPVFLYSIDACERVREHIRMITPNIEAVCADFTKEFEVNPVYALKTGFEHVVKQQYLYERYNELSARIKPMVDIEEVIHAITNTIDDGMLRLGGWQTLRCTDVVTTNINTFERDALADFLGMGTLCSAGLNSVRYTAIRYARQVYASTQDPDKPADMREPQPYDK